MKKDKKWGDKDTCLMFADCYRRNNGLLEICKKCGFVKRRVIAPYSDCGSSTPSVSPGYPRLCKCKRDGLGDYAVQTLYWILMYSGEVPEGIKESLDEYKKNAFECVNVP